MTKILRVVLLLGYILTVLGIGGRVFAQTPTPSNDYEKQKLDQISELQGKIDQLQKEGKTLTNQIDIMNKQIQVTELRIDDTNEKIDELGQDID